MTNQINKYIGALWNKIDRNGANFYTGQIEFSDELFQHIKNNNNKLNISIFLNNYKKEDVHPDYRILIKQKQQTQVSAPW